MTTKAVTVNQGAIGSASWKNNSLKSMRLSHSVVNRSDKSCELGRSTDPLPQLRQVFAELSNQEAHKYFRETRAVVCDLRESLIDTNEEIKSLTRGKEAIEKALAHIRQDIQLNQESQAIRKNRPQREKVCSYIHLYVVAFGTFVQCLIYFSSMVLPVQFCF